MKPAGTIFIVVFSVVTSCSKVYDPHIATTEKVLVVDGRITNKTDAYHIVLSYARSFTSSEKNTPAIGASVYVTDDMGYSFKFNERDNGDYVSDSLLFTGHPGYIYRLHIVTADGTEYESDPQRMFPEVSPDNVYAEFDNEEVLSGVTGLKVNTHGASIFINIRNQSDTLPRFRIVSNLVIQYYRQEWIMIDPINEIGYTFQFYCWKTVNINSNFNLTDEQYLVNSASIKKHPAGFLDDNYYLLAQGYEAKINREDTTAIAIAGSSDLFLIHHRILYLNQYTLNNETYLYYKSLYTQIQSEGKLFDPVAAQLIGNIKCKTDTKENAIGFFEASSVSYSEYVVDLRNLVNSQPVLIKTPYIPPPEADGCRIDRPSSKTHHNIPSFWISTGNTTKSNL
ncbi:MAG: DUF4249 domain-containing protein [Bacteroidales bacterium]|jgi:hypothetical protein